MISKNRIAFLRALQQKKNRREQGLFVAEGTKTVLELLHSPLRCSYIAATAEWWKGKRLPRTITADSDTADEKEMERISSLSTAPDVLAVFEIPVHTFAPADVLHGYTLAADGIRDPGNLGTLIRIADWFGISRILCSADTAEVWNPKTVQATMGSLARVQTAEVDLPAFLQQVRQASSGTLPVFGTFLEGDSVFATRFPANGIIVIGSESHGIGEAVKNVVSQRITIPSFSTGQGAESLNAGVAAGIICAEMRRQTLVK
ncbi:MAG: RNA methyltransferase [Bacteroidia bacterium]|jgi:TrmH family RNA methyltransferase|nr:RNA methyltransferase [Bacteroidia bacterium]